MFVLALASWHGTGGEVRYKVVAIHPPPGVDAYSVGALGINDSGEVVGEYGYYINPVGMVLLRAFRFSEASGTVDLDLPRHWVTTAVGINNAGQIALYAGHGRPVTFEAYRFTPGAGYEPLGDLGGDEAETGAINGVGQVTGFSLGPDDRAHAYRYSDGSGMENIGGSFAVSRGFAINDQGWVAGYADGYAFLYRNEEEVVNIGPGRAYGMNNKGSVAGVSWDTYFDQGFVYREGKVTLVGPSPYTTILIDINNYDIAVGVGAHEDNRWTGLIWTEAEGLMRLNSFIPADSGWWLTTAAAINDKGQIVGQGVFGGKVLAYRLDPIEPKLNIERVDTNAVISWTPAWGGAVLESTDDLSAPDWQPITAGSTNRVVMPLEGSSRFFRLNLDALRGLCCAP
jgi:probable HAF family extracellular repeat protein